MELLSSVHAFEPGVDLALGLVPRHAVALLKPAAELRALTLDDVKIIFGELAPLRCFPDVVLRSLGGR